MNGNGHKPARWRNRIVGHGEKPASWFLANPDNWRNHPKNQQEGLGGSLDTIGWIDDVTVNKRTSEEWGHERGIETMVDGHLRVILALREDEETPVPFKYVDLTPAEEKQALLTKDPIGAMAAADKTKLDELMRQVNSDDARVQAMIAELAQKEMLLIPDEFPEYDESVENDVEYLECPECGHRWPK